MPDVTGQLQDTEAAGPELQPDFVCFLVAGHPGGESAGGSLSSHHPTMGPPVVTAGENSTGGGSGQFPTRSSQGAGG